MNTGIVILVVIVICGLMVGGILISLSLMKRVKRRYWEMYQKVEEIQQQNSQLQQQVTQIQQQNSQIQQQLNQSHQQIQEMHRHIELEQMSDLVKYSQDVGVIEQTAGIKMLKHIWKLKEENIDGNS